MVFGVLLVALGAGNYFGAETRSWTMWFPALFGLLLFACGVVALWASYRKHAMHVAAIVGMVGLLVTLSSLIHLLSKIFSDWSMLLNSAMALLCGLFVALALKSFIDARRARKKEGGQDEK
jgi:hypothetical protein